MSTLICYDGSASARRAVAAALAVVSHEDVTLLHAWSPPLAYLADAFSDPETFGGPSLKELERLSETRAREIAGDGERLARSHGAEVSVRVERAEKSVWHTILNVADELDVRLIVLGTRGLTAVQSALLGSVSAAVVHHSHRPVMIVPQPTPASPRVDHDAGELVSESR